MYDFLYKAMLLTISVSVGHMCYRRKEAKSGRIMVFNIDEPIHLCKYEFPNCFTNIISEMSNNYKQY